MVPIHRQRPRSGKRQSRRSGLGAEFNRHQTPFYSTHRFFGVMCREFESAAVGFATQSVCRERPVSFGSREFPLPLNRQLADSRSIPDGRHVALHVLLHRGDLCCRTRPGARYVVREDLGDYLSGVKPSTAPCDRRIPGCRFLLRPTREFLCPGTRRPTVLSAVAPHQATGPPVDRALLRPELAAQVVVLAPRVTPSQTRVPPGIRVLSFE
jgi:hypothetical protein